MTKNTFVSLKTDSQPASVLASALASFRACTDDLDLFKYYVEIVDAGGKAVISQEMLDKFEKVGENLAAKQHPPAHHQPNSASNAAASSRLSRASTRADRRVKASSTRPDAAAALACPAAASHNTTLGVEICDDCGHVTINCTIGFLAFCYVVLAFSLLCGAYLFAYLLVWFFSLLKSLCS